MYDSTARVKSELQRTESIHDNFADSRYLRQEQRALWTDDSFQQRSRLKHKVATRSHRLVAHDLGVREVFVPGTPVRQTRGPSVAACIKSSAWRAFEWLVIHVRLEVAPGDHGCKFWGRGAGNGAASLAFSFGSSKVPYRTMFSEPRLYKSTD
eukprot:7383687-Prymnesium_polylepis.1